MTIEKILSELQDKNSHETEFLQAAEEVLSSLQPVLKKHKNFQDLAILQRILEPERVIQFRVTWQTDEEEVRVNKGYRVQLSSALGPYKGGLRFHPTVNLSVLKFLAFEQTFKNALTGLSLGAGKGGADFNPKGRSDREVMRFCQAFMLELQRHIGPRLDVPAGDIGVGTREIGYLLGTYKKMQNSSAGGVLTGKGVEWGGSPLRTEATGYGLIYFTQCMMAQQNDSLEGKECIISGSGNVAQYALEKLIQLGAKPITASDSSGFIVDKDGIDEDKLAFIKELKNEKRGRIKEYAEKYGCDYTETDQDSTNQLWSVKADCAFPCATQNEIDEKEAENLVEAGVKVVAEGANMPLTNKAVQVMHKNKIMYAPGKATNAGGVAVSGIEMMQNFRGESFTREEVDKRLQGIMQSIHDKCLKAAHEYGFKEDYQAGANIAGFIRVADAMAAQGIL
jgi:glutamate dehydrogenase (NADP+)